MADSLKQQLSIPIPKLPTSFSVGDSHIHKARTYVERLLSGYDVTPPDQETIETLYRVIAVHFEGGPDRWSERARDRRMSPWAILSPLDSNSRCLFERSGFAHWYISLIRRHLRPRVLRSLIHAYLYHYRSIQNSSNALRQFCLARLEDFDDLRTQSFREHVAGFRLLEEEGPKRLAGLFIESSSGATSFLDSAGFGGVMRGADFIDAASFALLPKLREGLYSGAIKSRDWERCKEFLLSDGSNGPQLRLKGDERDRLAESALLPFASLEPDPDLKESIKEFLIRHWGDPRLDQRYWRGVEQGALDVLRRWLVSGTLHDFFSVLDRQARFYNDADRQWQYRSAFWSAYLDEGYISDAWIVLGYRAASDMRSLLGDLSVKYARLEKGVNARPDHAVLIMRVGSLVVAEWSHNSSCRVWRDGNGDAPDFYLRSYSRSDLVGGADYEQRHQGAPSGSWQRKLSRYIRSQSGIWIGTRRLMPDGSRR